MLQVHGFTGTGAISITLDAVEMSVPDDMGNRFRQMIYDWEFPPVEKGERVRANTIPPYVEPAPDFNAIDAATLNAALIEPGSVVRALGLVMFDEINKLRVKGGDAAYTLTQFRAALKAKMR